MKQTQVLVPLDGSEYSLLILPYIKRLLAPATNHLILLRVVEEPELATMGQKSPVFHSERSIGMNFCMN